MKDALLMPLVVLVAFSMCDFNISIARDIEKIRVMLAMVPPEIPGGLHGEVSANREVALRWNGVKNAEGYYVYYSTKSDFTKDNGKRLAAVRGTSLIHGNLVENQTYYYAVVSYNENGESDLSSKIHVTAKLVIGTTTIVDISQSNPGEMTLVWLLLPDTKSYNVYYRTAPGVTKANSIMVSRPDNVLTLNGLQNNTTYYFRVSAAVLREDGTLAEGPLSPEISLTSYSRPSIPVIYTPVYGQGGELVVSWDPASNAVFYRVYWGTSPGVDTTNEYFETTNTSLNHTGLSNMATYYYRVLAVSGPYRSSLSAETSKIAYGPLLVPASVGVVQTAPGELTVTWSPVENATTYNLYWDIAPGVGIGSNVITSISGNQYVHQGFAGGETVYYRVAAVNPAIESPLSIETSGQVQNTLGFSEIIDVAASAGGELNISWSPDPNAVYYELFWKTSPGVTAADSMITVYGLSYTHSGLTPGATYYYAVRGRDTLYTSPLSLEKSGTVFDVLGVPAGIIANRSNPGELTLLWGAVTGASSYKLYWATGTDTVNSSSSFIVVTGGATSFAHGGLVNGVRYNYRVSAYNEQCETHYCAPGMKEGALSVTTASMVAYETPSVPVITSVVNSAGKELTVTWGALEKAAGYELYYSEGAPGSWVRVTDTGANSYSHAGLKNNIEYFYQVRAYSGSAVGAPVYYSAASLEASGVSYCIPGAPVMVAIIPGNGKDTIVWENDMSCSGTSSVVYVGDQPMLTRAGDGEIVTTKSYDLLEDSGQYVRVLSFNGSFISPLSEVITLQADSEDFTKADETFDVWPGNWSDTGGVYQRKGLTSITYISPDQSLELVCAVENHPGEGVGLNFSDGRFGYLSWWVRCDAGDSAGDLAVVDGQGRELFHLRCSGSFYENLNSGSPSANVEPGKWFFVELRDIDWDRRRYSYYINGNLVISGASLIDTQAGAAARLLLYNRLPGVSYFDDITIK